MYLTVVVLVYLADLIQAQNYGGEIKSNLDRITSSCKIKDNAVTALIQSLEDQQDQMSNCLGVPPYCTTDNGYGTEDLVKLLVKSVDECNRKSIYNVLKQLLARGKEDLNGCIEKVKECSFYPPKEIDGKIYYMSKSTDDIESAMKYCKVIGGYLAEMNSFAEIGNVQEYIDSLKSVGALIAGSDAAKEGTWIFERTGKEMEVFDWYPGEPNNAGGDENCLVIWIFDGGKLNDVICTNSNNYQYLCEVES